MILERGDIILTRLDPVMGSEQGKTRPCIVVQNNIGNRFSRTTIIIPISSSSIDRKYPHNVSIEANGNGLEKSGTIKCDQIRAISVEDRVIRKIGTAAPQTMQKVDAALKISLALA